MQPSLLITSASWRVGGGTSFVRVVLSIHENSTVYDCLLLYRLLYFTPYTFVKILMAGDVDSDKELKCIKHAA